MADYVKVRGVAAADIVKIDGVAVADVVKCEGSTKPASGQTATRWVMGHDGNGSDTYISYAPHSDLTDWTGVTVYQPKDVDCLWIAYGKDGSGNPKWGMACDSLNTHTLMDNNNDVTDSGDWEKEDHQKKTRRIAWGNDVWVAIGHMDTSNYDLYRSTDGSTWSTIDLSGVSGIGTNTVYALASDGAGNWMFGQGSKIFASTDNASNWAEMTSYPGAAVCDIGFTNNTWVVLDAGGPGQVNTVGASAFATEMGGGSNATWGTQEVDDGSNDITTATSGTNRTVMACGNGVALVAHSAYTMALDVNGTSVSVRASGRVQVGESGSTTVDGDIEGIGTDGNGTWCVSSFNGDVATSTDNGATWTKVLDSWTYNGSRENLCIRANVYLPV
jgi:hypothetical protein